MVFFVFVARFLNFLRLSRHVGLPILVIILLAGCSEAITPSPTPQPQPTQAAQLPPAVISPPPPTVTATPTPSPSPTATQTQTPSPTATATATPRPQAILAVPAEWQQAAEMAIEQLGEMGWDWQLQIVSDPAGELASGRVNLALVATEEGVPAGQRPLALAIPFATDWEETTLTTARQVQTNGHNLIKLIPWSEMTANNKALRIDGRHPTDPDYPLQQLWSVLAGTEAESAATAIGPLLAANQNNYNWVSLAAVGDIMLDRTLGTAILNGRPEYPFANVAPILQNADLAIGNLECALGDIGQPADKSYTFQAPPAAAQSLALAGFDLVSLANNHALDFGPQALLQGIDLLAAQNVAAVGAGANAAAAYAPVILEVKGLRLAFLGYANVPVEGRPPYFDTQSWTATATEPGFAWATAEQIRADVGLIRPEVDHVIIILHSGYEYVAEVTPLQQELGHAAIEAGASMVIGHHAHILQGIEFYQGGVIVYGLANFAFTIEGPPETAILQAWLDQTQVRQIALIPAFVELDMGGQPRLAEPWEAPAILQQIYALTTPLNP